MIHYLAIACIVIPALVLVFVACALVFDDLTDFLGFVCALALIAMAIWGIHYLSHEKAEAPETKQSSGGLNAKPTSEATASFQ